MLELGDTRMDTSQQIEVVLLGFVFRQLRLNLLGSFVAPALAAIHSVRIFALDRRRSSAAITCVLPVPGGPMMSAMSGVSRAALIALS